MDIYNYYVLNTTATFHGHALSKAEMREIVFLTEPYTTFIIKIKDTIAGYILLTQYKKREAYDGTAEITLYLKPDNIHRGIGSEAVKYIEKRAVRQNIHVLIATICGENSSSINLVKKNGFIQCAYYKEVGKKFGQFLDIIVFQKIIS